MSGKMQLDLSNEDVRDAMAGMTVGGVVTVKVNARIDSMSEAMAELTLVGDPQVSTQEAPVEQGSMGNGSMTEVVDFGQED